ncbi:hypothetical protein GA0115234_105640 [Streptomyces sp. DvalAA-43]|nr:hypothetical protein GA0115234_105640 [Streptomyces sp. DvalAA-43]
MEGRQWKASSEEPAVESLQELPSITVTDGVTTRLRTVADLQGAVHALAVAASPSVTNRKDPST